VAPPAGRSPLDVHVPRSRAAATGVFASRTDPSSRRGEPALGLQADRRRTQGSGYRRLRDLGAQGTAPRRASASAVPEPIVVAHVLACARGKHARLRFPHSRDRLSPADLRAVLHLARDAANRIHRLHLESRRALGHPTGTQPRHATRQRPRPPVPHPRPRHQVHASTAATTTSTGRTARSGSSRPIAAIRRHWTRPITHGVTTSSAD
jgi:hypothetical protein